MSRTDRRLAESASRYVSEQHSEAVLVREGSGERVDVRVNVRRLRSDELEHQLGDMAYRIGRGNPLLVRFLRAEVGEIGHGDVLEHDGEEFSLGEPHNRTEAFLWVYAT